MRMNYRQNANSEAIRLLVESWGACGWQCHQGGGGGGDGGGDYKLGRGCVRMNDILLLPLLLMGST